MLLQVLLMIKNAEEVIERTLESYRNYADKFIICDTGSDDRTIEKIREMNLKNVWIHSIPFKGFSETRNECVRLAGSACRFTLFIDDSYELTNGKELIKELVALKKHNLLSVTIDNDINSYLSPRIYKSSVGVHYIGKIHEIPNTQPTFTSCCKINDIITDSGLKRTELRTEYDIQQLEGLTDPRSLYYISQLKFRLFLLKKLDPDEVIRAFLKRLEFKVYPEEEFMCLKFLATIFLKIGENNKCLACLFEATKVFSGRSGECYYEVYSLTGKEHFLKLAKENKHPIGARLPIDKKLYDLINTL